METRAKQQFEEAMKGYQEQLALWLVKDGKRDQLVEILRSTANAAARGNPVFQPKALDNTYRTTSTSLWFRLNKPEYKYTPDQALVSLRLLLESIQEETVTTTFLNQAGYRNFSHLFRR